MAWIKTIDYQNADKHLKRIYDRVKGPNDNVDNVLLIHSLRPHSLVGHMTLYKNVLHNSANVLPKWYLEAIGVYVSHLNSCDYCFQHHYEGLRDLLNDDVKAEKFKFSILNDQCEDFMYGLYLKGLYYARKLTLEIHNIDKSDITELKEAGLSDGEILEINQVTSYFNYVNRSVMGLGVNTDGDILGLSPKDDKDTNRWNHE